MKMDDLERAVVYEMDPSADPKIRAAAKEYCNNIKTSPDGWKICLQKLFRTTVMEVAFYCLEVIKSFIQHHYMSVSSEEQRQLRKALMTYLQTNVGGQINTPIPIKNKFAHILVLLFKVEYPEVWPNFFVDLFDALQLNKISHNGTELNESLVSMFLIIMDAIDQEIVSLEVDRSPTERAHNQLIKDTMREKAIKEVVEVWYAILVTYQDTNSEIVKRCLGNIRAYIGWIDISLIVNEKFIPLFLKFLNTPNRDAVVECFYAIVDKGMDPSHKITLLKQLQICSLMETISASAGNNLDFLCKVGRLCNCVGLVTLACLEKGSNSDAEVLLSDCLTLMLKYLNHSDDQVSWSVLVFALSYLAKLKKMKKSGQQVPPVSIEHLKVFLQILRNKMKYVPSFNFERKADEEADFVEYRKQLAKLFKNITQLEPELVGNFVASLVHTIPQMLSDLVQTPTLVFDIEVALCLFFYMVEGLPLDVQRHNQKFFAEIITALTLANIWKVPHRAVSGMYLEIVARYARFLTQSPDIIPNILQAFLSSDSGIRHGNYAFRSRASYLFKQVITVLTPQFLPYTQLILDSLKDVITFSLVHNNEEKDDTLDTTGLKIDDKLNLLEAIAKLIGASPDLSFQQQTIIALLTPSLQKIDEVIANRWYQHDTPDRPQYITLLCKLIHAVGTFSKGFPISRDNRQPQHQQVVAFWKQCTELILKVFQTLPNYYEIRKEVIFFFHRMVEALGMEIFPYLGPAITLLLQHADSVPDLTDFVSLLSQISDIFQERVFEPMNQIFLPLTQRIVNIFRTNVTPNSEEEREHNELKKFYFYFIFSLIDHKLANILRSSLNMKYFEEVLRLVLEGCQFFVEPQVQRRCFAILRGMAEHFGGHDQNAIVGFNSFLYQQVIRLSFSVPADARFNLDDAVSNTVLVEIVQLHKTIANKCGKEFEEFMLHTFLPTLNWPSEVAHQYMIHLKNANVAELKTFLRNYFKSMRPNRSTAHGGTRTQ
jgi:exportin-T